MLWQTVHPERCHRRLSRSTGERLTSSYIGSIVLGVGPLVSVGKPGIWKTIAGKTRRELVAINFVMVLGEPQI